MPVTRKRKIEVARLAGFGLVLAGLFALFLAVMSAQNAGAVKAAPRNAVLECHGWSDNGIGGAVHYGACGTTTTYGEQGSTDDVEAHLPLLDHHDDDRGQPVVVDHDAHVHVLDARPRPRHLRRPPRRRPRPRRRDLVDDDIHESDVGEPRRVVVDLFVDLDLARQHGRTRSPTSTPGPRARAATKLRAERRGGERAAAAVHRVVELPARRLRRAAGRDRTRALAAAPSPGRLSTDKRVGRQETSTRTAPTIAPSTRLTPTDGNQRARRAHSPQPTSPAANTSATGSANATLTRIVDAAPMIDATRS